MTNSAAVRGLLCTFKPHKDGGGTITLQLTDPEWAQFLDIAPELWTTWAAVRLNDETPSTGAGS